MKSWLVGMLLLTSYCSFGQTLSLEDIELASAFPAAATPAERRHRIEIQGRNIVINGTVHGGLETISGLSRDDVVFIVHELIALGYLEVPASLRGWGLDSTRQMIVDAVTRASAGDRAMHDALEHLSATGDVGVLLLVIRRDVQEDHGESLLRAYQFRIRGNVAYGLGDYALAEECYRIAMKNAPDGLAFDVIKDAGETRVEYHLTIVDIMNRLGSTLRRLGRLEEARELFASIFNATTPAAARLHDAYHQTIASEEIDSDRASELSAHFVHFESAAEAAALNIALVLADQQRHTEAEQLLQWMLETPGLLSIPGNRQIAQINLAGLYVNLERRAALDAIEPELIAIVGNDDCVALVRAWAEFRIGCMYRLRRLHDPAIEHLERAMARFVEHGQLRDGRDVAAEIALCAARESRWSLFFEYSSRVVSSAGDSRGDESVYRHVAKGEDNIAAMAEAYSQAVLDGRRRNAALAAELLSYWEPDRERSLAWRQLAADHYLSEGMFESARSLRMP